MATDQEEHIFDDSSEKLRYLIVRPENGGIRDLYRFYKSADRASADKFLLSSDEDVLVEELLGVGGGGSRRVRGATPDRRWVIVVSIIVRKIILLFGKPMAWGGGLLEFLLNVLSENGSLLGLILSIIGGNMVMPKKGSETYISAIGHLDSRIDLFKSNYFTEGTNGHVLGGRDLEDEPGSRAIMDLCMMASKLSYENVNVVRNVVNLHWKMHFVDFYNCWNDYQKERSTQVFILCDKPKDANIILISFRGTEPFDADDWITDWDYSWYEIPKLGKVHMGFLEALGLGNRTDTKTFKNHLHAKGAKFASTNGFSNSKSPPPKGSESSSSNGVAGDEKEARIPEMVEMTAYFAVRSKLRSLLREHKNAKFIVTGHSLGGALAILFPTVLELHEETEMMDRLSGVYTYGQPRVGNQQLGKFMEARLDGQVTRYFRVVYCNDLVPRLPYDDKTFLYKHFGECLYYNSLYTEQKVDEEPNPNYFGIWFVIPVYLNAVWELIRSLFMGYTHGPEYKEGWVSVMLRVVGLAIPGLSAHSPTNYVNSIRLGRENTISMSSL